MLSLYMLMWTILANTGFEEVEHKKEVHKQINYLTNQVKPLLYAPFHTPRRRRESKTFRRQQISGNTPSEQLTIS